MIGGGWLFVSFWYELGSLGPWIGAAAFIIVLALALLTLLVCDESREAAAVERRAERVGSSAPETAATYDHALSLMALAKISPISLR